MMDAKLTNYLKILREKYEPDGLEFPNFCHRYSYDIREKKILVVLQDPGNPGAIESRACSLENDDDTARRQWRVIVEELMIPPSELLFWNFYPFFDWEETIALLTTEAKHYEKIKWAKELLNLAQLMDNLRLIVVSGKEAWNGMQYFDPISRVPIIGTPHPSNRGINNTVGGEQTYIDRWRIAKQIAYGCNR